MEDFKTTLEFSGETYEELKKHYVPSASRKLLIATLVFAAIVCVISAVLQYYQYVILLAVMIILDSYLLFLVPNIMVKVSIRRMREETNAGRFEYTTSFSDIGAEVINHATNATSTIRYENFKRFAATENYYVLFTKSNLFVPINRKEIDGAGKRYGFIFFLKSKCKNIKRWPDFSINR